MPNFHQHLSEVLYLPCYCTSHGHKRERDRGKKRSISVRCFTFHVPPFMVTSTREIEAFTSHGREKGKKRRRGREVPPSSLLLQRKEDCQGAEMVNQ